MIHGEIFEDLCKKTHFSESEIKDWYKGFIKDCPSGNLSKKEFCEMYKTFFPDGEPESYAK